MLNDLHSHELEVVKTFFSRGIAWAEAQSALESAALAEIEQPNSETVESVIFSPFGAHQFEQIVFRSVINELNALCEFALQNVWIKLSGHRLTIPNDNVIYCANRGDIEKAIRDKDALGNQISDVEKWPQWSEIKKIKELSEGFKHRQRLQPFPGELHSPRNQWRSNRLLDPNNENWISEYELTAMDVAAYIEAVEVLFSWLTSNRMW